MNIIFIFDSTYPNYTGGIETWIYNVCERLINKHEITIITVKNYRNNNEMGKYEDINPRIKFLPVKNMNHVKCLHRFVRSYIALINNNVTVYNMYRACRAYINSDDTYYVIGLGTVFAAKTVRLIKNKYINVKAIASCRSLHPEIIAMNYPGTGRIAKRLEKKNLKKMDAIWTNGLDTQQALKKKGFESVVIKNGVDFEGLDKAEKFDYRKLGLEGKILVATIGTVQKIKGYYEIIKAIKYLKDIYKLEIHFVGIGKGKISVFNRFAEELGVWKQVHLIGEHRNVVSYAKGADIMVCTSAGGGYGMAILESMVSQTPIIGWDTPVYQQLLIDEVSAKLVKPWDAKALADGIFYMLTHRKKIKEWGIRAREKAKQFDWSIVIEEIETALLEMSKSVSK